MMNTGYICTNYDSMEGGPGELHGMAFALLLTCDIPIGRSLTTHMGDEDGVLTLLITAIMKDEYTAGKLVHDY